MARPGGLQLGPEIIPHDTMHCRVAKVYVLLFGKPLLDLFVAAEPLRLGEAFFEPLHHIRWNRLLTGIGTGLTDFLELLNASLFVELKPIGNRVAMNAQVAGRSASALGLSSLHEKQHVIAALDLSVSFLANKAFELLGRLGNLREIIHGRKQRYGGGREHSRIDTAA